MTTRTVLVVDDDAVVREVLAQLLVADGFRVLVAANGEDAVHLATAHPLDAVLLDLGLPDGPGIQVCQALGRVCAAPGPLILVLTGSTDTADVQAAFDAGAADYLLKPFSPSQVRARLRTGLLRSGYASTTASSPAAHANLALAGRESRPGLTRH